MTMEGFPSAGAWMTYALGSENEQLPAFVAINDPRGLARSGKNNFGNGFYLLRFKEPTSAPDARQRILDDHQATPNKTTT